MADIILNDEDILAPFTEETPVHESFINPIITCVNKNTIRSKENTSAIGQIANDRGYITAKRITLAEMETTFENGKYFVASMGFLDVTAHDVTPSSYCKQTLYYLGGDLVKFRTRNVGVWTPWKEIATTEKISFVCTPKAGFVISRQENYRIGKVVYFALSIDKTDNSTFAGNTFLDVANIPSGFYNNNANIGSAFGFSAEGVYTGSSYFGDGAIQILVSGAVSTTVRASGVVAL